MTRLRLTATLGVTLALLLTACGGGVTDGGPLGPDVGDDPATPAEPYANTDSGSDTTTDPDDATDDGVDPDAATDDDGSVETTDVTLYFLAPGGGTPARADPFLIAVERELVSTPQIARATVEALIDGPTADDDALIDGLSSAVPAETLLLGITIDDGVATVDLSREFESGGGSLSMFARLAQVVYSVTQFPTVDAVQFNLEGDPVTVFSGEGIVLDGPVARDDYLDLLPTVFIDSPAAGAEVELPLRLTGRAAVFEATFQYRVTAADGTVLVEDFAMSDNGMGWGDIDVTLDVEVGEPTDAMLTVWEYSAQDGSIQAERDTPIRLLP
jgi:spore germination protein GerM